MYLPSIIELKELVHLHSDEDQAPEGESLTVDEVRIIKVSNIPLSYCWPF